MAEADCTVWYGQREEEERFGEGEKKEEEVGPAPKMWKKRNKERRQQREYKVYGNIIYITTSIV